GSSLAWPIGMIFGYSSKHELEKMMDVMGFTDIHLTIAKALVFLTCWVVSVLRCPTTTQPHLDPYIVHGL
ncbi:hypothetical protein PJI17_32410, partial [Mycobacterium kansasii]